MTTQGSPAAPPGPPAAIAGLSDEEWLATLKHSIENPEFEGLRLPGFPPPEVQERFVGCSGEPALEEAFAFYVHACRALDKYSSPLATGERVLDFGCGWGRILRFFLKYVSERDLFGVDPMPAAIELCRAHWPCGNVLLINDMPPLPLRREGFQLIYAFSVFSHLSEETASAWIEELASLLAPGGLLVATSRNRWFIEHLAAQSLRPRDELALADAILLEQVRDLDAIRAGYDRGRHVFVDLGGATEGLSSHRYGEAFVPEAHVRRSWGRWMEPVEFHDNPAGLHQSLIVLRKPSVARSWRPSRWRRFRLLARVR